MKNPSQRRLTSSADKNNRIGLLAWRPFRLARIGFLRLLGLFSRRHRAIAFRDSLLEKLARGRAEMSYWEEQHKKGVEQVSNELGQLFGELSTLNLQVSTFSLEMRLSLAASAIESLERLDKIMLCLAKVSPIMDKNDWWIIEGLPITFYENVLDAGDSLTTEELNKLITQFFNNDDARRLSEMVESWDADAFNRRKEVFAEALWAHRNGKYKSSVSVLVPQVEGVVRDFVKTQYGFTHRSFFEVRAVFTRRFSILSELLTETSATIEEIVEIVNYYNLRRLEALYEAYAPEAHHDPQGLRRHAVAHGLWLDYGKEEMSTRLFLLLDMLHSMLKQLESRA